MFESDRGQSIMLTPGFPSTGLAAGPTPELPGASPSTVITAIDSVKAARALPAGSVVGDQHGGLTFSDPVAAALEGRSSKGWREVETAGQFWTLIVLDRPAVAAAGGAVTA